MRILAISGSLKATSTNSALLRAGAALAPEDADFCFFDRELGDLPHFSPDLDEEGMTPPATVAQLRALVADCDGLLISCPEYAHGVPGSFKNALDWLVSTSVLSKKPVAVLMASPSGAPYAQTALMPTLRVMEADIVFEASLVFAGRHLAANGRIKDSDLEALVRDAVTALAAAIGKRGP
ncbi:MAG: NADPH-dependent FMN reductase [Vicinamibacterales bacterium]